MAYSVVGAPALGFDLTRLAGGSHVAEVLRVAIAAGPVDLERLAVAHPGAGAREQWRRACVEPAAAAGAMRDALPLAGPALDQAVRGETRLLRRLETSLLGDAHALDRLVRRELLDWTWLDGSEVAVQDPVGSLAADVLIDAATSAYLRDALSDDLRRAMAAPYLRAGLPRRDDDDGALSVGVPDVDARLARIGGADAAARAAWRRVVDDLRPHTAEWAPAMHQATWALSLAERLRSACDAQLAAVVAFARGGFTAQDTAYGVWNAWSGVVQATAVSDLLPAGDQTVCCVRGVRRTAIPAERLRSPTSEPMGSSPVAGAGGDVRTLHDPDQGARRGRLGGDPQAGLGPARGGP